MGSMVSGERESGRDFANTFNNREVISLPRVFILRFNPEVSEVFPNGCLVVSHSFMEALYIKRSFIYVTGL